MLHSQVYQICIISFVVSCSLVSGQDFSIDQASPEYPGTFSSADLVLNNGMATVFPAASIGLIATDEVDAFSYGLDTLIPANDQSYVMFGYSVTRTTVGAGGVVTTQASGNGAAGDKFQVQINGLGATRFAPFLRSDAPAHTLTPLPPIQSDADGLSVPPGGPAMLGLVIYWVYFSVDAPTAARLTAGGLPCGPGDILCQGFTIIPPQPPLAVFATAAQLGLAPGDDIDALAIRDTDTILMGTFSAPDLIYVSLTPASPSAAVLGTASVIQVNPGPPTVIFPPASLDLLATDDLNAMTAWDPGDFDASGGTDFVDYAILARHFTEVCDEPNGFYDECIIVDMYPPDSGDGVIDFNDLAEFVDHWLGEDESEDECTITCDFNNDGFVTASDLLFLVNCYGPAEGECEAADENCDGVVNEEDYNIFMAECWI